MNLKHYLLLHITLVAIICLITTTAYVLIQADKVSKYNSNVVLESITKQLEMQLLQIDTGLMGSDKFPDFSLWKETSLISGICISYIASNNKEPKSICKGVTGLDKPWPIFFERLYRWMFSLGVEMTNPIVFKGRVFGVVAISSSVDKELKQAWGSMLALLELSIITITFISILVYLSINRALRPSQIIVTGLEQMQQGDLTVRLPSFDILEWQQTSTAINQLAINQQQLLIDRKQLSYQLITLQDEERRYLARELHDELGQCLSAISALAVSISQTAEQNCPQIVSEAKSISKINGHIMETIHSLLLRLRATDIEELGLELSLKSLIEEANQHSKNTYYQLTVKGDCQQLEKQLVTTIFRIIQESISNIVKHSSADSVKVLLSINTGLIELSINDNGDIDTKLLSNNSGFGLLGIRERVFGLNGAVIIDKNELGGLSINITLPIPQKRNE